MKPNDYAVEVDRTRRRKDAVLSDDVYLTGHTLGLVGESGEICDLVKKWVLHGHAPDHPKLIKEIGDVLWYNIALRLDLGLDVPADWSSVSGSVDSDAVVEAAISCAWCATTFACGPRIRSFRERQLNDQIYDLAALALACGVDLGRVAATNIAKLRERFPVGFTSAASQARVDVAPVCQACPHATPGCDGKPGYGPFSSCTAGCDL